MRRVVVVVLLVFLGMDSVWTAPSLPATCQDKIAAFPEHLARFVNALKPFAGRVSVVDRVRSLAKGKAPPTSTDKKRRECDQSLIRALDCSLNDEMEGCFPQTFLSSGDLAGLLHTVSLLQRQPGWLVHNISDQVVRESKSKQPLLQTASEVAYYAAQTKIVTTLKSLLDSPGVFRRLLRGKVDAKTLTTLGALHLSEVRAMFEAVGKKELTLQECKELVKLAPDLDVTERRRLFSAVDLLMSLKLGELQGAIADQLAAITLGGNALTKEQLDVALKVATGKEVTAEEIALLTGVSVEVVRQVMGKKDGNGGEETDTDTDEGNESINPEELRDLEDIGSTDELKEKMQELFGKIDGAANVVRGDIVTNLQGQLLSLGAVALDTASGGKIKQEQVEAVASKVNKQGGLLGAWQALKGVVWGAIGATDTNKVVQVAKVVVWGAIYAFLVFTLVVVGVFINKRDWVEVLFGEEDEEESSNDSNSSSNNSTGVATFLLQQQPGSATTTAPRRPRLSPIALLERGRDRMLGLLQRQGLSITWSGVMWVTVILYVAGLLVRTVLWKLLGLRIFYLKRIADGAQRWYARDDLWSLLPVIIAFVPLCIETIRYFYNPVNNMRLANVYLEVISLVSVFNLAMTLLNSSVNPYADKVLARYVEMHKAGEVDTENEFMTCAEVADTVFTRFMKEQKSVPEANHCSYDELMSNFVALPANAELTSTLLEHVTVIGLCEDMDKTSQRSQITHELETFENMLVKVSLAFGSQQ